jgi:4-hydroxy-2-oxoheptanedioate aldolase
VRPRADGFKQRLASGRRLLGTFVQLATGDAPEIVASAGFVCAIIDAEHGMLGADAARELLRACDASGIASIYRVPRLDAQRIGHALDLGASAVMVPNVGSADEARRAVAAAKFHPLGMRGICPFTRAAGYDAIADDPDFYRHANERTAVALQIEGASGLAELDAILAVPGIDCVFVGPFDLSQSLGCPGEVTDPRVLDGIARVARAAAAKGIALGNFAVTPQQADLYLRAGARFLAYGTDTLLLRRAYRAALETLRPALDQGAVAMR